MNLKECNTKVLDFNKILDKKNKGWLVSLDDQSVCISAGTKIEKLSRGEDHELVRIISGHFFNRICKFPLYDNESYFVDQNEHIANELNIELWNRSKMLILNDYKYRVICESFWGGENIYLGLPDYPHKKGYKYINEQEGGSRFAENWFPFYDSKKFKTNTYLHTGTYSEGCITVPIKEKHWSQIYIDLISSWPTVDDYIPIKIINR